MSLRNLSAAGPIALATCLCLSASAQPPKKKRFSIQQGRSFLKKAAQASAKKAKAKTFEQFKASVFKEPGRNGVYIVNGDTPIVDEAALRAFYDRLAGANSGSDSASAEFTVNRVDDHDDVWSAAQKRRLTYCVSRTFGANYNRVVAAMNTAANAWEAAADINFTHVTAQDNNCTASNNNVLFDVRPVSFGAYLARAFFPNYGRSRRNVLIDNSSFSVTGNLTLEGILRHELGHTLGARHEHTRPESGTCFEDGNWRGVTSYDPFSVMHYPQCNGQGDWSLVLTAKDKQGIAALYGRPRRPTVRGICAAAVVKVPWDYKGSKNWNPVNVKRLCKGAERSIEPAKCFRTIMHGGVNWGTSTKWNWKNAIDLCQGTRSARKTVACFKAQVARKVPWKKAIERCNRGPRVSCATEVRKVPWDYKGTKKWNPTNVKRLCKGAERSAEPAKCFRKVMHGGVSWGKSTKWNWKNAIDLCEGTQAATKTVTCFQRQIRAKVKWQTAIKKCDVR